MLVSYIMTGNCILRRERVFINLSVCKGPPYCNATSVHHKYMIQHRERLKPTRDMPRSKLHQVRSKFKLINPLIIYY